MNAAIVLTPDRETAQAQVVAALEARGLSVVRSFDLRSALTSTAGCTCPYHGTAACCCQYLVLLVYGPAERRQNDGPASNSDWPATLTLHSRGEITWVELIQDANAPPQAAVVAAILTALAEISVPVLGDPVEVDSLSIAEHVDTP